MDCENNDAEFDDWAMNKYLKENDPERVISFKTIGFYILFLIDLFDIINIIFFKSGRTNFYDN